MYLPLLCPRHSRCALQQHEEQNNIIKILFLGAGESGKSTLVKQMNLLYGTGFPPAQCEKCKADLHANAIEAMKVRRRRWLFRCDTLCDSSLLESK